MTLRSRSIWLVQAIALATVVTFDSAYAQCREWADGFGVPGPDAAVAAWAVFDDGSGPALYAGGGFIAADSSIVNRIAKWDGTHWSGVGTGLNGSVAALTVFDDGSGPALYAGGFFTTAGGVSASRIAKWDGTDWSALGSGLRGPNINALAIAVFDDGSGPALYVAGNFWFAGGANAMNVAKWSTPQCDARTQESSS